MKTALKAFSARILAYALASLLALEPALAQVTISQTPLATSGGNSILANLMFILDDSGSMGWDYLPDYVNDQRQCMVRGSGFQADPVTGGGSANNNCARGDAPFEAGGQNGSNGVAYDPNVRYLPALNRDGSEVTAITVTTVTSSPKTVPNDAFGQQDTGVTDVTSAITERRYCNSNSVCKRNGATADGTALVSGTDASGTTMSAGRFPYRTHASNSSTQIFGLPEMMAMATFTRSSTTVTGTTLNPHGLAPGDIILVILDGSSDSGIESNARTLLTASGTTFTYTTPSGSGTISAKTGVYRRHVNLSSGTPFSRLSADSFVTVTSPAHELVTGDMIRIFTTDSDLNPSSSVAVTVPTGSTDTFTYTYTGASSGDQSGSGSWVRTGLYNDDNSVTSAPAAYTITPIEYCSDANLTDCVEVLPGNSPPSGFAVPAYVRFCQTQQQALAPGAVGDSSGTPRCRGKFVESGSTLWRWARYGLFNRTTIQPSVDSYPRSTARSDCVGAPTCTYNEEITNYARWFTYYRTRMQMMKTAAGRAFRSFVSDPPTVQDKLRVGFITINPYILNGEDGQKPWPDNNDPEPSERTTDPAAKYLKIASFTTAHADAWYTKFYGQKPGPRTPLREALARVGWIYSGKLDEGLTIGIPAADDPVQAACQRNFTLLTTDGYWNGEAGQDLAGNAVGNLDNVNPTTDTPYTSPSVDRATTGTFDGGFNTVVTTETPTVTEEEVTCYGGLQTTFSGADQRPCGCGVRQKRVVKRVTTQTQRISTTDGVETLNENPITSGFVDVTACVDGDWVEVDQFKDVREVKHCRDSGGSTPVTFWDSAVVGCTSCSSTGGRVLIEQRRRAKVRITKVDGITTNTTSLQTVTSGGSAPYAATPAYRYSGTSPTSTEGSGNWKPGIGAPTTNTACNTSGTVTGASSAVAVNNGGEVAASPTPNSGTFAGYPDPPGYTPLTPNPSVPVVGMPTTTTTPGGYPDTLADVAMYYYRTDLRGGKDINGNLTGPSTSPSANPPGGDVSSNVVPAKAGAKNFATHQHMVSFTLGLVDGLMRYQADYETASTGDFLNIKSGTANGCFWVSGTCNWPQPAEGSASALDDLWHAAVSGRGQYFLSKDVEALQAGIQGTLNAVNAQVAAAAASATSSPNITQTNNQIFSTTYETITWSGKVFAQTIDPNTGNVNPAIQWHADTQLLGSGDCSGTYGKACASADTRSLYTFTTTGTKVKPFTWASLDPTTEQNLFKDVCEGASAWAQCATLAGTPRDTANDGTSLLAYLRGQTGNEGAIFRDRTFIDPATNAITQTILGDTISAKPAYVREATFNYGGSYTDFKSSKATRAPRVYVGANDGFLHAFDGDTGQEAWGYTPRFLMPGLFQLADHSYTSSTNHQYYVDGSPETGDVCATLACAADTDWRTILVGGVNGGGRGFYALDISSMDTSTPGDDPKGLWEFCEDPAKCAIYDDDLGLSYGNAVMGRRYHDDRSIIVLTSGLNNTTPGTGEGFFYVLDAVTGEILHKVATGFGDGSNPSGLMKISAFYDNALTDPRFRYVYGGDQLGNVFRFDLGGSPVAPLTAADPAPTPVVVRLTTLKDGAGRLQPITTRPALTHIGSKNVLYVGTGRYLGDPDLEDQGPGRSAWQHSLYAFIDSGATYPGDSLRDHARMKRRDLTAISPTERGILDPSAPGGTGDVDWTLSEGGWFIDFNPIFDGVEQSPGEGVNIVDPRLVLGTLVVTTNAPAAGGSCAVGGTSYFYNFDFKEGTAVSTSPNGVVGFSLGGTITVGVAVVQLPSGAIKAISTGADTTKTTSGVSIGASSAAVKRFSYRVR